MDNEDIKCACIDLAIRTLELSSEVKKPAVDVLTFAKELYAWVKEEK